VRASPPGELVRRSATSLAPSTKVLVVAVTAKRTRLVARALGT